MSLMTEELLDIPLYYMFKTTEYGSKRLTLLDDDKAKKMLEDPDKKDQVQILNTKWKQLSWKEQNDLMKQAEKVNAQTGMPDLDWNAYQDVVIKKCLKSWDYTEGEENPQPVQVTPQNIDKMHSAVIRSLLNKFSSISDVADNEMEKF